MIHESGPRREGPFVPVNCGAIPDRAHGKRVVRPQEGQLHGRRGRQDGLIQTAEGGTLFLDEVADLPLHMQVKLLRVIQEKTVRPVGRAARVPVDVRISERDAQELWASSSQEGRFREDLYYRINVIELHVPPLRDRGEDMLMLAHHALTRLAAAQACRLRIDVGGARRAARATLPRQRARAREHPRARADAVLRRGDRRRGSAIARAGPRRSGAAHAAPIPAAHRSARQLEDIERDAIVAALEQTRYNKTAAAKVLGMTFRALRYRIKKLGIE